MPRAYEPMDTKNRVCWLFCFLLTKLFKSQRNVTEVKEKKKYGTYKKIVESNGLDR